MNYKKISEEEVKNLELHETITINGRITVTRVVNGFVYEIGATSVFVPETI